MLAIMEKFLNSQGYSYVTMDGTTSIKLRQSLIKNFNEVITYTYNHSVYITVTHCDSL